MKSKMTQKRKPVLLVVKPQCSKRQGLLTVHKRAQEDPIRNGILYIDKKARDGLEKMRMDASSRRRSYNERKKWFLRNYQTERN